MSRNNNSSLTMKTPNGMGPGVISTAVGTLAVSAIQDAETSAAEARAEAEARDEVLMGFPQTNGDGFMTPASGNDGPRPTVTTSVDPTNPPDDGDVPQKPAHQTTHVMIFTYKGSNEKKRKPRKMEATPPELLVELSGEKKKSGPLKQYETDPKEGKKKDQQTSEGIASGKYYSMVHQFPDIIAKYELGPTNLDRETWTMRSTSTAFVPLTARGHERIAEYQRAMEEKATLEAYEKRLSVRWRKGFKTVWTSLAPARKFKAGEEYLKDKGLPVFPEDKARARKEAAEAAQKLREAEEAQKNMDGVSEMSQSEQLPQQSLKKQQKSKGRSTALNGSDDEEEEDESYPAFDGPSSQQQNSLATRFKNMNTDDSANAGYVEGEVKGPEKTFKVPTRRQNAFLNKIGKEVITEEREMFTA